MPPSPTSSLLSQPIYDTTKPARPNIRSLPDNSTVSPFFDPDDKRGGGGSSGGGGGGHGSGSGGASKGGGSSGGSGPPSGGGTAVGSHPVGAGAPAAAVGGKSVICSAAIVGLGAIWMGMMV